MRFAACAYWPAEMKLYQADKPAYFKLLDGVVRSAEKHHVGLIPSLFWAHHTVPDLVGESCDQWGNADSKTRQFMRTYAREVVLRYRESPAIWAWEFGNEYNLAADLPNAAQHRPPVVVRLGTPPSRTKRDEMTSAMVRAALAEFAKEVRGHDPSRMICSGNATPRSSAWHQQHERSWKKDTPEQLAWVLQADNPDPIDSITLRLYPGVDNFDQALAVVAKARKPVFVGEFGSPEQDPPTRQAFERMLSRIEAAAIPLAAVWVFDFAVQEEWSITATNTRSYQLNAIRDANRRLAAGR